MWVAEGLDMSPLVLLCLSIGVPLAAIIVIVFIAEAVDRFRS